jgi:hypothetical protein
VPVEQNPKRFAVIPYLDDRPDMRSAQAGHSGPPLVIKLYALSDQKRVFHGCRPVDPIVRSSKQRSEIRSCLRAAFLHDALWLPSGDPVAVVAPGLIISFSVTYPLARWTQGALAIVANVGQVAVDARSRLTSVA